MRFHLEVPEAIQIRESRGYVKDIYDPAMSVKEPLSEYRVFLDLVRKDSTLATCYDIVTEFSCYRGFDFIRGTKAERDKYRQLFEELNFLQVLPNIFHSLVYNGDCFLELRKNNSATPNELWVLETTEMRIIYDKHGKIGGYVQRPFNFSGMLEEEILRKEKEIIPESKGGDGKNTYGVFFKPDEVIHFRMKWIGSQVYSYNPNEPISKELSTSRYISNYLMAIFMNMPPRYVAHLAGISVTEHAKAKLEFQAAKTNYTRTIAFTRSSDPKSKLTLTKIEPPYDKELLDVKKWINGEIAKITRVPRTWVEESGVENRGVGESINLPFEVHIQYIHRNIIEPLINRILMKQLAGKSETEENPKDSAKNLKKIKFRFNEISRKAENEILMNVGLLRDMGLKPEALVSYLDERGILGLDPEDFDEMQLRKNMELNPSRERMNPAKDSMTQDRNQAGVSDKSAVKMGIKNKAAVS